MLYSNLFNFLLLPPPDKPQNVSDRTIGCSRFMVCIYSVSYTVSLESMEYVMNIQKEHSATAVCGTVCCTHSGDQLMAPITPVDRLCLIVRNF